MPNLPTQDELDLIAFAAGEKDKHRPMISTADAGSDCPSFERLAEIIAAQAEAIDALETERGLWKSTAKGAKAGVEKDQRQIRDMSAALREHRTCRGES